MRLAFVSPLPPAATGIADYAADVLALLAPRHDLTVFHAQEAVDTARLPAGCTVHHADELKARHAERPFDLAIHQLGNGPSHDFVYDALTRLPGLLVLHDLVLHHARARMFLDAPEVRRYAAAPADTVAREAAALPLRRFGEELAAVYPDQAARLAAAALGSVGDLLAYAYPLFRIPVAVSRATAVHNGFMARAVADEVPDARVCRVPMPIAVPDVPAASLRELRQRLGFATDDVVVGSFGLLTREKRIETLLRAMARARVHLPALRLLLVGPVPDRAALDERLVRHGLVGSSVVTGRVPHDELPVHVAAADIVVQLRYPSARETSAALLRVLAAGRPTIVSDLENLAEVPDDAVVRADLTDEEGAVTRALLRLGTKPSARERLGQAARRYVDAAHAPERCVEPWESALTFARDSPIPHPGTLPAHWNPDVA